MPQPADGVEAGHTTTEFQLTLAVNAILGVVAAYRPDLMPAQTAAMISAATVAVYALVRTIRKTWGR